MPNWKKVIVSGSDAHLNTLELTNTTTNDSILITSTDAGASAAPLITLKRNSGSPANSDYLGQVRFKGENNADQEVTYAKISGKILDITDSSEDGIIEFSNMKNGSQVVTMRLRSDSLQLLNSTSLSVAGNISTTATGSFGRVEGTLDFADLVIENDEIPISKLASDAITIGGTSTQLGGSITTATILDESGVVSGSAQINSLINDTIAATIVAEIDNDEIPIAKLAQDSITIAGNSTALGGSITQATILDESTVISGSGSTNITTVGTISTGTWNGTSIATSHTDAKVTSIVAGDGIDVSGATGDVTVTAETATATNPGVVELATTAETTTGTDTARAVTPDGLKDGYQGSSNVTTVGALNAGSITSGFTSIDVGSGTIQTTGTGSFGRVQASVIGGNSPLKIEADNFNVNTDGTVSGSSTSTGSFGSVFTDGGVNIGGGFVDIKNNGSQSQIRFYCEVNNAHFQTIKAAPHSETASNTLVLPSVGTVFATTDGAQTLTNKTLTSPDINSPDIDGGTVDSITSLTAANDLDIGAYELRAQTFESDVTTGTAPFTVASTTLVSNLNSDKLDGQEGSYYLDFPNFVVDNDEIPIAKLAQDAITIAGNSTQLGGSITAATILNGTGVVSGSSIASSAQGQVALTTNGVAASAVDLGLQTGDSPTFAGGTLGNIKVGVTGDNEIDTSSGNLTLDSAGGTITLDDDVIVSGNFTVSGTQTIVDSTTVNIADNIIELNAGTSDGGIFVKETQGGNATGSLIYDVSENRWIAGNPGSEVNLVTIDSTDTLTNKTIDGSQLVNGSVANGKLANDGITIAGVDTSLGGTITQATILDESSVVSSSAQINSLINDTIAATIVAEIDNDEIPIAKLASDAITIAGNSTSLGGSITQATILNGSTVISGSRGIANDNLVEIDDSDVEDNDYAKFTANGLEGRSFAEVRSDLNVEDGADVTDTSNVTSAGALMDSEVTNLSFVKGLTSGISNGNVLVANAAVSDNDFLKVDGTSIEGRTAAEVRSDLNVEDGADVTDTTNVTAAGALMDSECTSLASVKAINQGLTTSSDVQFNDLRADSIGVGMAASSTSGRLDCTNDVAAFSSSDRRWKKNIINISNPLDKISKIGGYEFDWKELTEEERETQHGNSGHDVGVIAQEIQEVLPEVVKERDNGYLAVDYEKIVPLLIESIKELKNEVEELKKKV